MTSSSRERDFILFAIMMLVVIYQSLSRKKYLKLTSGSELSILSMTADFMSFTTFAVLPTYFMASSLFVVALLQIEDSIKDISGLT